MVILGRLIIFSIISLIFFNVTDGSYYPLVAIIGGIWIYWPLAQDKPRITKTHPETSKPIDKDEMKSKLKGVMFELSDLNLFYKVTDYIDEAHQIVRRDISSELNKNFRHHHNDQALKALEEACREILEESKVKPPKPPVVTNPPPQQNGLTTLYDSPREYLQDIPWVYPVAKFPEKKTKIWPHRYGSSSRTGFKDSDFAKILQHKFGEMLQVTQDVRLNTSDYTRPYEPDIAIIDHKSILNIRLDIEIDEPYAAINRNAIHLIGDDDSRDTFFLNRGWIVVRFTEHQVHTQEAECVNFLAKLLHHLGLSDIKYIDGMFPQPENQWDLLMAQKWEREKWRESYLEINQFGIQEDLNEVFEYTLSNEEKALENEITSLDTKSITTNNRKNYNKKNSHIRDNLIEFQEMGHKYFINGISFPSATEIVARFFKAFDAETAARNLNPNHRYFGLPIDEIVNAFRREGEIAATDGGHLHQQIENYLFGEHYQACPEMELFLHFIKENPTEPYRTEWTIFSEDYPIAGTIDFIGKRNGEYVMYDWKRSKKVVNPDNNEPITVNNWGNMSIGALRKFQIDDTSYNRYCIQQNLYRHILLTKYNIEVNRMYLVVLHPDLDNYVKVSVPVNNEIPTVILKDLSVYS